MRPFHWWRTVFYLIPAVSVYTIVLGTASLLSTLFDRTGNFAHRCARAWASLILKTTGVRVSVQGLEHLEPGRSYVFAANHQSIYDIPIVFTSIPFQLRIVAKESLRHSPTGVWMNCDWPPSRCGGTTMRRAMMFAALAPSSLRTMWSAASMPAAVPAPVTTLSSCTKSTSGSTSVVGNSSARRSVYIQWVVARRPSSTPARPSACACMAATC